MKYIYVGKIVNTHALKGEVRIISNFEFKERVFLPGVTLYIGQYKNNEIIETCRKHKQFDMVKFKGIDYINDVLKYKGENVYVSEDILNLSEDEILESEYTDYSIFCNNDLVGRIQEYRCDNGNKIVMVNDKYIPYNKDFIDKVDKANKKIYMHDIEVFL